MAIRPIQDLGGLGRLADTILQKRALDQQRVDKERAFGLQESAADLQRRVTKGQLTAQQDAAKIAAENRAKALQDEANQRFIKQGLSGLLSADLAPGTGGLPQQQQLQQASRFVSAVPGGGPEDIKEFLEIAQPLRGQKLASQQRGQGTIAIIGGKPKFVSTTFDPGTGQETLNVTDLPEGATVAPSGETPEARQKREEATAGGKAQAIADVAKVEDPVIKKLTTIAELEARIEKEGDLEKVKNLQKDAAKAAESAIAGIPKIEKNIENYENAIKAVRAGAGTGTIEKLFPSFKASSIELDNIQGLLAMDVIGSVTFGALSKGELDLAKVVGLPTGLEGEDLIKWIEAKRDAQIKMGNIMREAAVFLSEPGNTRADWIKKNASVLGDAGQATTAAPQPVIEVDF